MKETCQDYKTEVLDNQAYKIEMEKQRLLAQEEVENVKRWMKRSRVYLGFAIVALLFTVISPVMPDKSFSDKLYGFVLYGAITTIFYVLYFRTKKRIEEASRPVTSYVPVRTETVQQPEVTTDTRKRLLHLIVELKMSPISRDRTFRGQLSQLEENIETTARRDIQVPQYVYDTIGELLEKADHFSDETSPTLYDDLVRILNNGLKSINEAFEKIISQNNNEDYSDLETTLSALETKLNIDGYLE